MIIGLCLCGRRWDHLSLLSRFAFRSACIRWITFSKDILLPDPLSRHCRSSYMEFTQEFCELMKECGSMRSIAIAQKLHSQLIRTGLCSSVFIQNHLLHLYYNCDMADQAFCVFNTMDRRNIVSCNMMLFMLCDLGRPGEARKMFDLMPERDYVSWNSIMSGYLRNGKPNETLKVFISMIRVSGYVTSLASSSYAMQACAALGYSKLVPQLHGLVVKFNLQSDMELDTSVVSMYLKCGMVKEAEEVFVRISSPSLFCCNNMIFGYSKSHQVERAVVLFNRMPERSVVTWNNMISLLAQHGFGVQALNMFITMWNQGVAANSNTHAAILAACTSSCDLQWGAHFHARLFRAESSIDAHLASHLVSMYAKCGSLSSARMVFTSLKEQNAASWTSMVCAVAQSGLEDEALLLFRRMRQEGLDSLDEFILTKILWVCSSPSYIHFGRQLHACTMKTGIGSFLPVGNALIMMYARCGEDDDDDDDATQARHAFELMPARDAGSWAVLIAALSRFGDVEKARSYFRNMPEKNDVTYNTMMGMYLHHRLWEDCIRLYGEMRMSFIKPDNVTFLALMAVCAELATLELGIQIVAQVEKSGFSRDAPLANSTVSMYSRCGKIEEARKVFDSMSVKDLVLWNTMMAGYGRNGQGRTMIEVYDNMLKTKQTPDHTTFLCLLSGCGHSGLVAEAIHLFQSMTDDHGISPSSEHFACMVGLLGRAGLLEQAKNAIDEMASKKPTADALRALLGACKIHHNPQIAEFAVKYLSALDAETANTYNVLASIYSRCGRLEKVAEVRSTIKTNMIRKDPGFSWIGVAGRVHVFTVGEMNHIESKDITVMLMQISVAMKDAVPVRRLDSDAAAFPFFDSAL